MNEGLWLVNSRGRLMNVYNFMDFKAALEFVNRVGHVAEKLAHHPDIHLTWGRVVLEIWNHQTGRLGAIDFELAASITDVRNEMGDWSGALAKEDFLDVFLNGLGQ